MYSPPVGGAARRPSATIDKQNTNNGRFIIYGEKDYLCGNALWQMAGRDSPERAGSASKRPRGGPSPDHSHQSGTTSPRVRSSQVCRLRISANLSPSTSASASSGRE